MFGWAIGCSLRDEDDDSSIAAAGAGTAPTTHPHHIAIVTITAPVNAAGPDTSTAFVPAAHFVLILRNRLHLVVQRFTLFIGDQFVD